MKKLIIGLTLLSSFSTFADTSYSCSSKNGKVIVTEKDNNNISINFADHKVKSLDYFETSYFDLLENPLKDIVNDETKPQMEGWNAIVNVSYDNLEEGVNKYGYLSQRRFVNNEKKLIVNSDGGQDFSYFDTEFSLNKTKLTARIKYSVSAWFRTYGKINDKLKCEKF